MAETKAQTIGELLKQTRKQLGLSLTEVELATKIRGKYLVKLEAGDQDLPNDIYIKGFVKKYADFLNLDGAALSSRYVQERGGRIEASQSAPKAPKTRRVVVTPKLLIAVVALGVLGMIVAYLGWQFSALAAAPRLEVASPTDDQVIYGSLVDVSGHATAGADVLINDSQILTDADGNFNDKLALVDGVNTIAITARNRLGKSSTITRSVLAHLPEVGEGQLDVPAEKFDGIAVGVKIKDAATWLVVEVDGKEVFRGTMLAGTSQTFKGSDRVKLTTGNAGATSLLITNAAVAQKSIDPVGQPGEIKRNLDFAKDTVIQ